MGGHARRQQRWRLKHWRVSASTCNDLRELLRCWRLLLGAIIHVIPVRHLLVLQRYYSWRRLLTGGRLPGRVPVRASDVQAASHCGRGRRHQRSVVHVHHPGGSGPVHSLRLRRGRRHALHVHVDGGRLQIGLRGVRMLVLRITPTSSCSSSYSVHSRTRVSGIPLVVLLHLLLVLHRRQRRSNGQSAVLGIGTIIQLSGHRAERRRGQVRRAAQRGQVRVVKAAAAATATRVLSCYHRVLLLLLKLLLLGHLHIKYLLRVVCGRVVDVSSRGSSWNSWGSVWIFMRRRWDIESFLGPLLLRVRWVILLTRWLLYTQGGPT